MSKVEKRPRSPRSAKFPLFRPIKMSWLSTRLEGKSHEEVRGGAKTNSHEEVGEARDREKVPSQLADPVLASVPIEGEVVE
ncbi:hypothetical protein MA16_Dca022118 [Dendrobium catenatum]|uniref:Uncharacterized protein n=1 Tax=Dendrobium catenatum TaxID=906689 RepID=A0A2I0VJ79_9ASPA|nr:hypothetical protein MA16_Dca022118 [Dendrobium catenatum]